MVRGAAGADLHGLTICIPQEREVVCIGMFFLRFGVHGFAC